MGQCLREIPTSTGIRSATYCRARALSAPTGTPPRADLTLVPRSLLTLDLSSARRFAKINFVAGGTTMGTKIRAGQKASLDGCSLQPSVNCLSPFISGGWHTSVAASRPRLGAGFYLFCSQERFLLDFLEISAVACSTAFIEVPVRRCCHEQVASHESCARGAAKDRESGCGQQHQPSKQRRHRRLCRAMP